MRSSSLPSYTSSRRSARTMIGSPVSGSRADSSASITRAATASRWSSGTCAEMKTLSAELAAAYASVRSRSIGTDSAESMPRASRSRNRCGTRPSSPTTSSLRSVSITDRVERRFDATFLALFWRNSSPCCSSTAFR